MKVPTRRVCPACCGQEIARRVVLSFPARPRTAELVQYTRFAIVSMPGYLRPRRCDPRAAPDHTRQNFVATCRMSQERSQNAGLADDWRVHKLQPAGAHASWQDNAFIRCQKPLGTVGNYDRNYRRRTNFSDVFWYAVRVSIVFRRCAGSLSGDRFSGTLVATHRSIGHKAGAAICQGSQRWPHDGLPLWSVLP